MYNEQVMDNLRMITLNLNCDFDAWKPEGANSQQYSP